MKTILLTGKTGQVGWELQTALASLGRVIALDRAQMDLSKPDSIRIVIREAAPDIIVNAAAYTAVDKAESEPELAMMVNGIAPGIMAEEAKRLGALLVHYSTDYVFNGTKSEPYTEDDETNPLNVYGKTKLAGERAISATGCDHLILRTSWVYSGRGTNFLLTILRLARERRELAVVDDQVSSPTWAGALTQSTVDLLGKAKHLKNISGTYHLAAEGFTTWFILAQRIIELAQELSNERTGWAAVRPTTTAEYPLPAVRPLHSAMSKEKIKQVFGIDMPDWQSQLMTCLGNIFVKEKTCKTIEQ